MNLAPGIQRRIRLAAPALLTLLFSAQTLAYTVPVPQRPVPESLQQAVQHWQAVLKNFVSDRGQVDFKGLRAQPDDLESYVAWVARFSPQSHPGMFETRQKTLAYYLNSYNALSMYNVLADGLPESLSGLKKIDFFYFRELKVGGRFMSLHDYENKIIRPLGDERVHFALNCMAVSCPQLPRQPFRADTVDADLDRETRRFFASPDHLRVDHQAQTIQLSELIDFYPEDFLARAPTLIAYLNRYIKIPIPGDYQVEYIPYNWRVNRQP